MSKICTHVYTYAHVCTCAQSADWPDEGSRHGNLITHITKLWIG